jgi:hypothetical protein
MAAAVSDWRVESASAQKLKKNGKGAPSLRLVENPDILARVAQRRNDRPALVIGFAAETEKVVAHARAKLAKKGCDWILANDVSPGTGTFGGDENTIQLVDSEGVEDWPVMTKREVATRLAERIAAALGTNFGAPPGAHVPGAGSRPRSREWPSRSRSRSSIRASGSGGFRITGQSSPPASISMPASTSHWCCGHRRRRS